MKQTNWTIFDPQKSDWVFKKWVKILKPQHSYQELRKTFWQYPVSKNSCSIHGVFSMVANTFNVDFTLEERKAIWAEAKKLWASDSWGWRFSKAIKLVRKWCSENKGLEFNYFAIQKEEFKKYALLWFPIYWGIKIKEWSTRDKLKDGYVWDDVESYWDTKLWHALIFPIIDWEFWMVDNYPWKTKYNEVKFRNLEKLLAIWFFFDVGYICCRTDEVVRNGYNRLTLIEKITKLGQRASALAKKLLLKNK